eukprot:scaffold61206_cov36-Phaeocystis_antarctica.AAC.2
MEHPRVPTPDPNPNPNPDPDPDPKFNPNPNPNFDPNPNPRWGESGGWSLDTLGASRSHAPQVGPTT